MGTGDMCRYPQQRHATEEPGKVQGRDRVGIVESSRVNLIRRVPFREKFALSRNPEYKTSGWGGVAMDLNVVLTPG